MLGPGQIRSYLCSRRLIGRQGVLWPEANCIVDAKHRCVREDVLRLDVRCVGKSIQRSKERIGLDPLSQSMSPVIPVDNCQSRVECWVV
jgi:hypothetical protein